MIVTVTLNAAIDRTLLVPNFQLGHRHRASSAMSSAGGKGINVARSLKRLGVPVVCAGLAGGRTGVQIVERLTSEGLLNDFVRIRGESRTSTAVVDPTSNVYTEINEWGPEVEEHELAILREKLSYLDARGGVPRPRGLAAPRRRRRLLLRGDPGGQPPWRAARCSTRKGEPLRLGVEAEPYLVSPNVREAEQLVGHEFSGDDDLAAASRRDRRSRRAQRPPHARRRGASPSPRGVRDEHRLEALAPAARADLDDRLRRCPARRLPRGPLLRAAPPDEALRAAVATGAASVLEAGAGRFDVREVNRLSALVQVRELEPVAGD